VAGYIKNTENHCVSAIHTQKKPKKSRIICDRLTFNYLMIRFLTTDFDAN